MRKPKADSDQQLPNSEEFLCNARYQALKKGDLAALLEANQELWEVYPRMYQRLVGPIYERHKKPGKSCYCSSPKSLYEISGDILSFKVPNGALDCDDCWEIDLLSTWMSYKNMIPPRYWSKLCELREIHQLFLD